MRNNPTVSLDGSPTKYSFGDRFWYVSADKSNPFKLKPYESSHGLEEIQIGKDGKIYYCFGRRVTFNGDFFVKLTESYEENAFDGYFWSEEEAQKWIDQNMPEKLLFTERSTVYAVYVDSIKKCIEKIAVTGLTVSREVVDDTPVRIRYELDRSIKGSMDAEELITEKPVITYEDIKRGNLWIKSIYNKIIFPTKELAQECFPKYTIE